MGFGFWFFYDFAPDSRSINELMDALEGGDGVRAVGVRESRKRGDVDRWGHRGLKRKTGFS